ncbi:MAG: SufD family Fe-S cluster assembly protein [Methanomassiliicoccaceae archaeon]|nr:SufD family Fe-S cluster assembly protein [Methanomassiliicoccaceae archaeon]
MQNGKDVIASADKKAAYGPDIDIGKYKVSTYTPEKVDDIEKVSDDMKERMVNVGVTPCKKGRSGTLLFVDNGPSHISKHTDDIELMSIREAAKRYDLSEYLWKAVEPEKDKYTSKTYLEDSDGYFIRVKAGKHIKEPVQTCMLINRNKQMQNVHNIVIVEEGASLEIITGCTTSKHAGESLHIGISETFIKDNASLTFSMIHNWGESTHVRPRSGAILGKNAKFVNNYVILNRVGSVQSYPAAYLNGEGASAKFSSICLSHEGSDIDMGSKVELNAQGTSAEIISRSITLGGRMIARGRLSGNASGAKAHLECRSLVLRDGGLTFAVPELESTVADVEMTHEAAVGKIARDQVEYLMMRGLTEDEAVGMIVRGFLEGGITGLPEHLKNEIDNAIEKANLGS